MVHRPSSDNAIEIDALHKSFGDTPALRDLSLTIAEGETYGLLGPQGAGKSTLVHILLGLLRPSAGWVEVLGSPDVERVRGRIGYLPERARYHTRYAAREYLRFLGAFDGLGGALLNERIDGALRRVGLWDEGDRQLGSFSRGKLQRLGVAQALLNDPELLILDEPFSGLDPAAQIEMLELLNDLRGDGRTMLITTPPFPEIERLCDRIGVLTQGRLAAETDAAHLRHPAASVRITLERLPPELAAHLRQLGPAVICGEREVVLRPNSPALQGAVMRALLDAEATILALVPQERPLERLYLQALRGEPVDVSAEMAHLQPVHAHAVGETSPTSHVAERPVAAPPPSPPSVPRPEPQRPGEGDTLLRELLRRDKGRDES